MIVNSGRELGWFVASCDGGCQAFGETILLVQRGASNPARRQFVRKCVLAVRGTWCFWISWAAMLCPEVSQLVQPQGIGLTV